MLLPIYLRNNFSLLQEHSLKNNDYERKLGKFLHAAPDGRRGRWL